MNDVRAALVAAAQQLSTISETPRLDAELLMAHALGTTREAMLLSRLADHVPGEFAALVARRTAHEPLAYITGRREFWTLSLQVTPAVLIPRPDSETLIETAILSFGAKAPATVLDLGTGSGALLLAALSQWPKARGLGIDRSAAALDVARKNAWDLGFSDRADFRLGDWTDGVSEGFDLILCNPPYVEAGAGLAPDVACYEPAAALFAGEDGLDDYRRVLPQLPPRMNPGALAIVEIGATQAAAVTQLAVAAGMTADCFDDLGGRNRCLRLVRQ